MKWVMFAMNIFKVSNVHVLHVIQQTNSDTVDGLQEVKFLVLSKYLIVL